MAEKCIKCGSTERIKNGMVKDKQRWKCLVCGYNYRVDVEGGYPDALRQMALQLYLEGLSLRAIERLLGVSNVTVLNWVKDAKKQLTATKTNAPSDVKKMEVAELCEYIARKTIEDDSGWLLIEKPRKILTNAAYVVVQ